MSNISVVNQLKAIIVEALSKTSYNVKPEDVVLELNQKNNQFGEYACALALQIASKQKLNPQDVAKTIVSQIPENEIIAKTFILGPGFINFNVNLAVFSNLLSAINTLGKDYGRKKAKETHVNVEFVSANPTGNLHLGHARNAAIGDSLANIFIHEGYKLTREYYVNDAGNQMNTLALSLFTRYKNLFGQNLMMPQDAYHGQEVILAAEALKAQEGNKFENTPFDAKTASWFLEFGKEFMLGEIKKDLLNYGVKIDSWFHESKLYQGHDIKDVLKLLKTKEATYELDGAVWLSTTRFGDDKDRVLVKQDRTYTYLLPDLVYHYQKIKKHNLMINIWGADHSGYVARMKAGLSLLGEDAKKLLIVPTQMVRLVKDGQEQKMSKRTGTAITLKELLSTIGKDALRYFMISRTPESHLDIDVDLATKKSSENPVFYLQYAHARIKQIIAQKPPVELDMTQIDHLTNPKEKELLIMLDEYESIITKACDKLHPHLITNYLQKLAKTFHSYYNECKIINQDSETLTNQRLNLVLAIKQILFNGLSLIGVSAPNKM